MIKRPTDATSLAIRVGVSSSRLKRFCCDFFVEQSDNFWKD
jgi:hypothetical protein